MAEKQNNQKLTKRITYTAILTALYLVLSALLKIPIAGHITVDLGYIALMVGCVYLGAIPGMLIGALGAMLESIIMSQRGLSIGWVLMNAIIGYICGSVLAKADIKDKKRFIIKAVIVVLLSVLLGVTVKTFVDCALYHLPLLAKIPTGLTAWILDSVVMLVFGMPLSMALKSRLKI